MVVTDGDLVFKLLSLPPEALEELLSLMGESESEAPATGETDLVERLADPARRGGTSM